MAKREENLERKSEAVERQEKTVIARERDLDKLREELTDLKVNRLGS